MFLCDQTERAEEKETLHYQQERLAQLQKESQTLELKEWTAKQQEQHAAMELQARAPAQLKPQFAKTQDLAQVSSAHAAAPILTHVSHGIAVPSDSSARKGKLSSGASAQNAYQVSFCLSTCFQFRDGPGALSYLPTRVQRDVGTDLASGSNSACLPRPSLLSTR